MISFIKSISYLWILSKILSILSVNFIVLTSHSGFFFFLLVDLLCFEAKYLTGRRGRMLWSPTRNPPLVAIFDIFLISRLPVCRAQAPLGDVRNEAIVDVMDRWGLNPTGSRSSLNMVFTVSYYYVPNVDVDFGERRVVVCAGSWHLALRCVTCCLCNEPLLPSGWCGCSSSMFP